MQKLRPIPVVLMVQALAGSWLDGQRAPEAADMLAPIACGGPFPQ